MEAFLSDGLRTLLITLPIREMSERTPRWPGHVERIRPLVESGRFVEEMRAHCVVTPPDDLVALLARVRLRSTSCTSMPNRRGRGRF